ncbi:hypothetical protein [Prosthecobacter sp.]|uniref:hypothetical protein n=1 Tax=Prosthecobacter sp. TaxID=1965333 RepID=UPI0037851CB2
MKRLFLNILHASPQNTSDLVLLLVVAVWVVIWVLLAADVAKHSEGFFWKVGWLVFCSIPILGGCLYSIRELVRADWSSAFSIRRHDAAAKTAKSAKNHK